MKRLLLAITLLCPSLASAQWFPQDGWYAYGFDYTTSATFNCGFGVSGAVCSTTGNTVTIMNGGNSATFGFAGYTGSAVATNVRQTGFMMGAFTVSYTGATPFQYPLFTNVGQSLFGFRLNVTTTNPGVSTGTFIKQVRSMTADSAAANCCDGSSDNWFPLGVTRPPAAFVGSVGIVVDNFPFIAFKVGATPQTVTGSIGIVPEPSTWALMLVGLPVALLVKSKRRSAR